MDAEKLAYFTSRYSSFDEGELADLDSKRSTLVDEAAAALDAELARRGMPLSRRAEAPEARGTEASGFNWPRTAFNLFGLAVVLVVAKLTANILPRWVTLLMVVGWVLYWLSGKFSARAKQ